jgi:O-antigen/teichoic acid export membrane protein
VAPELVRALLGDKWLAAVPALMILPLIVPIRMICGVLFTTSFALGNRRADLRNTVVNMIFLPTGFFIGAHWGLIGLCSAWLVSLPLAYSITLRSILRRTGVRVADLIKECGAPALAAACMYGVIAVLRFTTFDSEKPFITLIALVATGAVVYVGAMAAFSLRHLSRARSFVLSLLGRSAPEAA